MIVAVSQLRPAWLNAAAIRDQIIAEIQAASSDGCRLIAFAEGVLPGYPFWIERTNGAVFNSDVQKTLHAHYLTEAVQIERGDLDSIASAARNGKIAVYLGIIERPPERSGHSLYASLVYINEHGSIESVHRKLMPTYEERLSWSIGDGQGLQVHRLDDFTVGGLNCWENWMPLARASLYAMGENVHVAVWPGNVHNTADITRFIARENRSYVLSASTVLKVDDIGDHIPFADLIKQGGPDVFANGGSCIAGPDGEWIVEPVADTATRITTEIDLQRVYQERQNFDPSGHYSRPDVFQLYVNRDRQQVLREDGNHS